MSVLSCLGQRCWILPILPILGKIDNYGLSSVLTHSKDFRSIPNDGGNDYMTAPALLTTNDDKGGQNLTSAFFNTTSFNNDWSILNTPEDLDATVPSINSAQNVFISKETDKDGTESTYLALRAFRLRNFASIAEIDSNQKNLLHSSIRARMRMIPAFSNASLEAIVDNDVGPVIGLNTSHPVAPGAVLGFFTYESDTQESDIEILTSDPTTNIHYSNQPDYDAKTGNTVPGASTDTSLPDGMVWTDWHDHRIDWYDGISRWYVDGQLVLEKTLNVPTKPSGLILNLWSDGGAWSGNMSIGAQVVAGFQWIEMAFNISGNVNGPQKRSQQMCDIGCNVDGVKEIGFPQVAFNVTGNDGRRNAVAGGSIAALVTFWCLLLFASANGVI